MLLQAKEMQRAEMEELRHREANNTALQAIGPRKKLKLDSEGTSTVSFHVVDGLKRIHIKIQFHFNSSGRPRCFDDRIG